MVVGECYRVKCRVVGMWCRLAWCGGVAGVWCGLACRMYGERERKYFFEDVALQLHMKCAEIDVSQRARIRIF